MMTSDFVDPRTTPFVEPTSRGQLPHLYKDAGTYFVTFRIWDAVGTNTYPSGIRSLDPATIMSAVDPPIRAGSCLLRDPRAAQIVQTALLHFEGKRYRLLAWSIMPNHVHVVFQPHGSNRPSAILHSWKSFTAHQINGILKRNGPLWEREWFDHLVRGIDHLERFIQYVEENPVVAGLCDSPSEWRWSSASVLSHGSPLEGSGAGETSALQGGGAGETPALQGEGAGETPALQGGGAGETSALQGGGADETPAPRRDADGLRWLRER